MPEIKIAILNIKKVDKEGTLKAIVDWKLNNTEFYSWRIIQQEGQKAWVSSSQKSWTNDEGKKVYKPLIKFPQELMKTVSEQLLIAWNNHT